MVGLMTNLQAARKIAQPRKTLKEDDMEKGERLVIVGCSGSGGPAAMMAKKLMPEIDVTIIRKEEFFIVR